MLENIRMIPIGWLEHHPENPRKDLGDLSELAESIKRQGIMQNLTIVPAEEERTGDYYMYWVVTGNRRLEASRMAGLKELPCMISDMDRPEQVATMLAENMHRADLTLYEQAKGIQMMMDLGFSKEQVEERTGFSRQTIERRLAVAALPEKAAKEAVELGYDLIDLVDIAALEDPKKQEELLAVGASEKSDGLNKQGLRQRIRWAQKEQEEKKARGPLIEKVKGWAKEMKDSDRWSGSFEQVRELTIPIKAGAVVREPMDKGPYYYWAGFGNIEIYRRTKKEKHVKSEAEIRLEERRARAKELNAEMRARRVNFVSGWKQDAVMEAWLKGKLFHWIFNWKSKYNPGDFYASFHSLRSDKFREFCGMPKEENRDPAESLQEEMWRRKVPLNRAMLAWMLSGGLVSDERPGYANEYNGTHQADADMDRVYEVLDFAGYVLTDEEKQWKDGTHPFYGGGKNEREPDARNGDGGAGDEE